MFIKYISDTYFYAAITFEQYLKIVFDALLAAEFCNCVTGRGDCENDGRTTVVVTGL